MLGDHLIPPGQTPFANDPYFGRLLLPGQDFIGASGFLSIDDVLEEIRQSGKRIILNIGDSSTAGWDTRVTVENQLRRKSGEPLLSAFFRYPTYTDLLRESVGDRFVVLNAGIPGHTSINALRRLRYLLDRFRRAGVQVGYVSIYIGNNDCQWENNIEDSSRLRTSELLPVAIDRLRLKFERPVTDRIRLRTNVRDFRANVRAMLRACQAHGAAPMVILPETPLYWEPGKRFVADLFPVDVEKPGGAMVTAALARASAIWTQALSMEWSAEKERALESARELDFVVPRIKRAYRRCLEEEAREMDVPTVRTVVPREQGDGEWFVDYCHPVGAGNEVIAADLKKTIDAYESGRVSVVQVRTRLLFRILDSRLVDILASTFRKTRPGSASAESENKDIYTLY